MFVHAQFEKKHRLVQTIYIFRSCRFRVLDSWCLDLERIKNLKFETSLKYQL